MYRVPIRLAKISPQLYCSISPLVPPPSFPAQPFREPENNTSVITKLLQFKTTTCTLEPESAQG